MRGTHNSLTFGRAVKWWARLGACFWKCQRKTVAEQIAGGCRVFDIRFARRRKGGWVGAHGVVDLGVDPILAIQEIARNCPGAYVRVILERARDEGEREEFRKVCRYLEASYPELTFFGGRLKPGWVELYHFEGDRAADAEKTLVQHVGSMQSLYGKVFPGLWAWIHRGDVVAGEDADELPAVLRDMV